MSYRIWEEERPPEGAFASTRRGILWICTRHEGLGKYGMYYVCAKYETEATRDDVELGENEIRRKCDSSYKKPSCSWQAMQMEASRTIGYINLWQIFISNILPRILF